MDPKLYATLAAKWKPPCHYRNPTGRTKLTAKIAQKYFAGKHVIDVGCNAGILAYEIAQFAKSLIALEMDPHFYEHAVITREHIKIPNKFLNCTAGTFCRRVKKCPDKFKFNALFACRVLYHLSKAELAALRRIILPHCGVVVCVSKDDKIQKLEKNGQFLWKRDHMIRWMQKCGFATETIAEQGPSLFVLGRRT